MSWKELAYKDEVAVLSDTAPEDVTVAAASAGVADEAARRDHKHDIAVKLNELDAPTAAVDLNSQKITGLAAGTAEGDAVALDVNVRVPDSTLLEGSTKSEVQDHTPKAHLLGGHTTDSLANLNLIVTDATLDDSGDPRDPNAHAVDHKLGGGDEIDLDELGAPTGPIDFAQQQADGLVLETAATGPDPGTEVAGQVYYKSDDKAVFVWVPA